MAAARIGRSIYVIGGFERDSVDGSTAGRALRHPPRTAGRASARMPIGVNHSTATVHARPALRARRLRAGAGSPSPPRRCSSTTRAATAGGGCARSPTAARGTRRGGGRRHRLYVAGGADASRSLRSLEVFDFRTRRWRRGPSFPGPARNHTTGVAAGGRFYVLAGRDDLEPRGGRALRPAAAPLGAAARTCASRAAGSPRRACRAAGSWCSAARTWRRAARRSPRSSCSTSAGAAGGGCRTCSRRATGSAAPRSATACTRSRAGRSRASTSRRALEFLDVR